MANTDTGLELSNSDLENVLALISCVPTTCFDCVPATDWNSNQTQIFFRLPLLAGFVCFLAPKPGLCRGPTKRMELAREMPAAALI